MVAIDKLRTGKLKKLHTRGRKVFKGKNPYMKLLSNLYNEMSSKTQSAFNKIVAKRIMQSNSNRPAIILSNLVKTMKGRENKVAVSVSNVVDDNLHYFVTPKLTVAALRFSESARTKIINAGGECITLDQLLQKDPLGKNVVLLRGKMYQKRHQYFGLKPGQKGSDTKQRIHKGLKSHVNRGTWPKKFK
eukprot:Mrub_10790.p1 GENE.Mrub_10790~~Mrub_10790.p1  ORF type:complete len:189 (-),score=47.98 Mrub_10790:73-639(-)